MERESYRNFVREYVSNAPECINTAGEFVGDHAENIKKLWETAKEQPTWKHNISYAFVDFSVVPQQQIVQAIQKSGEYPPYLRYPYTTSNAENMDTLL
jgi:hypothetical protein